MALGYHSAWCLYARDMGKGVRYNGMDILIASGFDTDRGRTMGRCLGGNCFSLLWHNHAVNHLYTQLPAYVSNTAFLR